MKTLKKRGCKTPLGVRKAQQVLRSKASSALAKVRAQATIRHWNKRQSGKGPEVQAVRHGILQVPAGKTATQLSVKHFVKLARREGHAAISRALTNLQRWNVNRNKKLSNWAKSMKVKLRKALGVSKRLRRRNPKTLHHVSTGAYRKGMQRVRTITFGKGIKARIAYPKGSRPTGQRAKRGTGRGKIITLLFDPTRYTLAEAKEWVRSHGYPISETAAAGTTKHLTKKQLAKKVVGKAVRCKGKSSSGKRCTRHVIGRRKYCWQHAA